MPIEGSWNTVKAFFLTEATLNSPDGLNTFANGSLWYVQHFFGRKTIKQQGKKFYLVQRPETDGNASWVPSSIKTAAYFFAALIWTLPGAFARLVSLDSKAVASAVFADRITPPSQGKLKVPAAPKPKDQGSKQALADAASAVFEKTITPKAPHTSSPAPTEPPETKQLETSAPVSNPEPPQEPFAVGAEARTSTDINHHRIFNELESSYAFFMELNAKPDNEVKDWLIKKTQAVNYCFPFLFAGNLREYTKPNEKNVLQIIPENLLRRLENAFKDAENKLQRLKLAPNGVEITENQPQDLIGAELLDYILKFYTGFISLKTNRAEWLQKQTLEADSYHFPFFNALYLQGWKDSFTPLLDSQKFIRLTLYHEKCVSILYAEGLEYYLTEIPLNLSLGLCAFVHCMTQTLTVPKVSSRPAQTLSANPSLPKPSIDDAVLKPCLMQAIIGRESLQGIQAILENDRLFQRNKFKLAELIELRWKNHSLSLKVFLSLTSLGPTHEIKQWIQSSGENEQCNKEMFSSQHLQLIKNLRPILSDSAYQEWNFLYQQCQQRLKKLKLSFYTESTFSTQVIEQEKIIIEDFLPKAIRFFNKFNGLSIDESAAWLARQASQENYTYPFFYSFDVICKMERLKPHLTQSSLVEWTDLYEKACAKLKQLSLTSYLDEIPPRYLEGILVLEKTVTLTIGNPTQNEPSRPQNFITSTRNLPRRHAKS